MKIQWFGQACFCIASETGLKLITDPYQTGSSPRFLYAPVNASADIVTVSHNHGDHDNVSAVSGNPVVVRNPGITGLKGIEIKGLMTFHDRVNGARPGLLVVSARQRRADRIRQAPRCPRAQLRRRLLGPAGLEGHVFQA